MISINDRVQEQLNTVLPTCYELFLSKDISIPCISYQITGNSVESNGNINCYERINLRVKLWVTTVGDMCTYSSQIDDALAELGTFERESTNELQQGELICLVMNYSILIPEYYSTTRYL